MCNRLFSQSYVPSHEINDAVGDAQSRTNLETCNSTDDKDEPTYGVSVILSFSGFKDQKGKHGYSGTPAAGF